MIRERNIQDREYTNRIQLPQIQRAQFEKYQPIPLAGRKERSLWHEPDHTARVTLLGFVVSEFAKKQGFQVNTHGVMSAARIHDRFRLDERRDEPSHGLLASVWADMAGLYAQDPDERLIQFITTHHSLPRHELPFTRTDEEYYSAHALMDADALDRVRSDCLNPDYLAYDFSRLLIPVAERLYYSSQRYAEKGVHDGFEQVLRAGIDMKLITE